MAQTSMTFTLQTGTWPGCMQEGACNYDPNAMVDSGCIYGHNLTCYWDSDEDGLWDEIITFTECTAPGDNCFCSCADAGSSYYTAPEVGKEYPEIYIKEYTAGASEQTVISFPFEENFLNTSFLDILNTSFFDVDGVTQQNIPPNSFIFLFYDDLQGNRQTISLMAFPGGIVMPVADTTGEFSNNPVIPQGAGLFVRFTSDGIIKWTLPT